MWEVYTGRQAWQGLHYGVVVERVVVAQERPPVPPDMPAEYQLLMTRCWTAEPNARPTFPQVCWQLLALSPVVPLMTDRTVAVMWLAVAWLLQSNGHTCTSSKAIGMMW